MFSIKTPTPSTPCPNRSNLVPKIVVTVPVEEKDVRVPVIIITAPWEQSLVSYDAKRMTCPAAPKAVRINKSSLVEMGDRVVLRFSKCEKTVIAPPPAPTKAKRFVDVFNNVKVKPAGRRLFGNDTETTASTTTSTPKQWVDVDMVMARAPRASSKSANGKFDKLAVGGRKLSFV